MFEIVYEFKFVFALLERKSKLNFKKIKKSEKGQTRHALYIINQISKIIGNASSRRARLNSSNKKNSSS